MDEQRLGALFRYAVGDPPPASFGRADVVAASRRATARRRNALAGAALFGVAVLGGGLTVGGHLLQGQSSTVGQAPPEADVAAADPGPPRTLGAPPGAAASGAGSAESEQTRCGPLDDELAAQLSALLTDRGAAIAGPPSEVPGPCPEGSRAAAVPVSGGMLYLVVVPHGWPVEVVRPEGAREHALTPGGGRELVVISVPAAPEQPAPLADDVPELAKKLAGRL